jgi:hypothetical protein
VFVLWIRTSVSGSVALTSPWSMANGPTAELMLPQLPPQSTRASVTLTCANV